MWTPFPRTFLGGIYVYIFFFDKINVLLSVAFCTLVLKHSCMVMTPRLQADPRLRTEASAPSDGNALNAPIGALSGPLGCFRFPGSQSTSTLVCISDYFDAFAIGAKEADIEKVLGSAGGWERGDVDFRSRPRWALAQKASDRVESSQLSVAGFQPGQFHGRITDSRPWVFPGM